MVDSSTEPLKLREIFGLGEGSQIQSYAEILDQLANTADHLASNTANTEGFTIARPYHKNAARNDFIRELSAWLQNWSRAINHRLIAKHELTADIANALFQSNDLATAISVQRLTRDN